MDQELMTLLNNIVSLVSQAKQAIGGEASGETVGGGEEGIESKEDGLDMEEIKKYLKDMEGESGEKEPDEDDKIAKSEESADKTVDEQPEVNEKNINAVAKMLMAAMKSQPVKKSDDSGKVIKALSNELDEVKKALNSILEGLGVADEIKKMEVVKKDNRPIQNADIHEIRKSLEILAGVKEENKIVNQNDGSHSVFKSLTDNDGALLRGIFTGRK